METFKLLRLRWSFSKVTMMHKVFTSLLYCIVLYYIINIIYCFVLYSLYGTFQYVMHFRWENTQFVFTVLRHG